ncbi:hypothetical protein B0H16DRAFT_270962 [Mycena metata]|uniref:Uncharacterized protein n=1 Tax=Mycena metata TaxID=1033252 RepID=A0AAD7HS58_9AGAR|nr:hypothetical protein B0H16DRAFT_270962 [Mycena metata]
MHLGPTAPTPPVSITSGIPPLSSPSTPTPTHSPRSCTPFPTCIPAPYAGGARLVGLAARTVYVWRARPSPVVRTLYREDEVRPIRVVAGEGGEKGTVSNPSASARRRTLVGCRSADACPAPGDGVCPPARLPADDAGCEYVRVIPQLHVQTVDTRRRTRPRTHGWGWRPRVLSSCSSHPGRPRAPRLRTPRFPPSTSPVSPAYPTRLPRANLHLARTPLARRPPLRPHPQSVRVVSARIHSAHRVPRPTTLRYTQIGRGASVFPQRSLAPSLGCTHTRGRTWEEWRTCGYSCASCSSSAFLLPLSPHRHPSLVCRRRWWRFSHPSPPFSPSRWSTSPRPSITTTSPTRRTPLPSRPAGARASSPASPHPIELSSASPIITGLNRPRAARARRPRPRPNLLPARHSRICGPHPSISLQGVAYRARAPARIARRGDRRCEGE